VKCLSIKFVVKLTACLALACLLSSVSPAQQSAPASSDSSAPNQPQSQGQDPSKPATPPSGSAPQPTTQDKNKPDPQGTGGKVEGTSNDRLFYALPNFLTLPNQQLPPLSVKDKFKVVALGNFDFIQYPWWAIIAAISQAENSEPQFRQGWLAYAKRYGTTAGDSSVENFMVGAVFPSILHQDPRFYYSENGGIPHRILYAVSRIFVTRSDSGHAQFNYSEIFGAATAAAVSDYTYHPRSTVVNGKFVSSDRTLSNTAIVFGTQLSLDGITFEIKEFWPDIHRRMQRRRAAKAAAAISQRTP